MVYVKIVSNLYGQFVVFSYLYVMKKDEIIELLKEQNKGLRDDNSRLLSQIETLTQEVSSLREALLQKDESLGKQRRITRGIARLVANTSERQTPRPVLSEEERKKAEEEKAARRKARKNNGAKRDMHYDMEEEEHDVYPDDPDFDLSKARLFSATPRICVRYECVPMRFIKHVYRIHTYTQDGRLFEGKTPPSAFLNSNYDGSFIAGLMELRYIHSMPVERIISYFEGHGFTLNKPTAHRLIEKASDHFRNLYRCIRQTVLDDPYKAADETYYKILVPEKNEKGKGVRKGYIWVVVGINTGMTYLLYDDGSRSGDVILDELGKCKGIIQSDGYSPYRKLQGDDYPDITRIPCLQHIKRKFIDCGENDPDAKKIVELINRLYQNEHKHKVGVDGWTVEQNLEHRKKYAPGILGEIKNALDDIEKEGGLLPKTDLQEAVTYLRNEWDAVVNIFNYGNTHLDNNKVERMNRYIAISRRNSLFFGSHEGAKRGAILYTIALTCRMHNVNLFNYLTDVINRTALWQPNTPIEKYTELLPHRWKQANE